jgi:two-component system CheB/CheR fusion protein
VAVLDGQGTIRVVNAAWRQFARDNGNEEAGSVGSNYFAALARSADSEALAILGQLQAVLDGRQAQFSCTYPCHAPDAERWFVMHATQLKGPDHGLVVTHFDVSALKSDNQRGPDPGTALPSGALDERSLA